MVPAIIAVILYLSLLYVCGRFTANYATQRGRSGFFGSFWAACFILFRILFWRFCDPSAKSRREHTRNLADPCESVLLSS